MEKVGFEHYVFQTVFGFTDSIFIRHGAVANITTTDSSKQYIDKFLEDCQHQLKVKVDHKDRFLFTIIFDKKNRYIAWTCNSTDRPILKNLDGMSRKYPAWIKHQIEKISIHALDFIERNIGKEGIEKVLHERQIELFDQYYKRLKDLDF
jgi:hypothetical protein